MIAFPTIIRRLQGERPGMGSELVRPTSVEERLGALFASPSIAIQTSVQLADVSFYQGTIDFQQMATQLHGVVIRAGQRTWVDSKFRENWTKAKAADLPRGSYWFYDSREKPENQAALWWAQVKDDPGELVHVADFEESYGGPYGRVAHFRIFLQEFQRLSGLSDDRIAIYTGYYWWLNRVGDDPFFKRYSLWIAWYTSGMSVVRVPAPWTESDLLLWQHTASGDGPEHGVSSQEIDLNWYCCTLSDYIQRFGLSEPPEGNNTMHQGMTNQSPTKIFNSPTGTQIDQLPIGIVVRGDAPSSGWVRITHPKIGYIKQIHLSNYVPIVVPPPPPPPPPAPAPITIPDYLVAHFSDGTSKKYVPE